MLGGSQGARLGGAGRARPARCGAAGLCPGLLARAGVRGRPAGHPLSRPPPATIPAPWRRFLATLQADDAYRQRTQDGGTDEASFLGDWFRSHPRTPERVARAVEATSAELPGARETDRAGAAGRRRRHALGRGPGAGRDPGHQLPHPGLGSRSRRRPASACRTRPSAVAGGDGQGRLMLFDMADGRAPATCAATCSRAGSRTSGCRICRASSCRSARPRSASARSRSAAARRRRCSRWSVARATRSTASSSPTSAGSTATMSQPSTAACAACARLSAAEAAAHPCRCASRRPGAGWRYGRHLRAPDAGRADPRGLFVLLNGLDRGRTLQPGDQVKVIRHDPLPAPPVANRASPPRSG